MVASAEAVWAVLAAFDRLSTWADDVEHSAYLTEQTEGIGQRPAGAGGTHRAGRAMTEWDPPAALAYALEGLPPVVGGATNRWTLQPMVTVRPSP